MEIDALLCASGLILRSHSLIAFFSPSDCKHVKGPPHRLEALEAVEEELGLPEVQGEDFPSPVETGRTTLGPACLQACLLAGTRLHQSCWSFGNRCPPGKQQLSRACQSNSQATLKQLSRTYQSQEKPKSQRQLGDTQRALMEGPLVQLLGPSKAMETRSLDHGVCMGSPPLHMCARLRCLSRSNSGHTVRVAMHVLMAVLTQHLFCACVVRPK